MKIIDADRLITTLRKYDYITYDIYNDTNILEDIVNDEPPVDAIVIPKNATMSDMFKIMFPDIDIEKMKLNIPSGDTVEVISASIPHIMEATIMNKEWWTSPFRQEK